MRQETFRRLKRLIRRLGFYRKRPGFTHSDGVILAVHFWAVLNDRPISWACEPAHWPPGLWRGSLPTQSCLSRRTNTTRFESQLARVEHAARASVDDLTLVACLDGKPLPIAWHSRDPHAGKGRGAGALARGYKVHAITDARGRLLTWRLASLHADEKTIGRRLLRGLRGVCYIVGDAAYNANRVFEAAAKSGAQLIAPRKRSHRGQGLGNHPHHPHRLRSIELLEDRPSRFAIDLLKARAAIERFFSRLTCVGGGLTCLPSWVRTYPRVNAWVTAKITAHHLRYAPREEDKAA